MKLKEIYEKEILSAEKQYVDSGITSEKPVMVSQILTPDSIVSIQPIFNIEFELDKEGMYDLIEILERYLSVKDEKQKKNLMVILTDVYAATEKYLGGHGIPQTRQQAYLNADENRLKLSEIKDKKIGLCAERTAMAHQLLTLLEKEGPLENYTSYLTNSHIKVNEKDPHAFIILQHKEDKEKNFLFDIENPMDYKVRPDTETVKGIALYSMNAEELEKFKDGKCLKLKSVYENLGMTVIDDKRMYGYKEEKKERER